MLCEEQPVVAWDVVCSFASFVVAKVGFNDVALCVVVNDCARDIFEVSVKVEFGFIVEFDVDVGANVEFGFIVEFGVDVE